MTASTETPTVIRSPDSKISGPSRFGRFLGRLILALLKLLVVLLIIAGLLAAGWLGYQEFDRSIGEVNKRVDLNSEQTTQLRGNISTELSTLQSQQSKLEADTAQMTGIISVIGDDLMRQIEMLTTMEEQVAVLEINADSIGENVTALDEGVKVLQSDITTNGTRIGNLGEQIDELGVGMNALRGDIIINSEAVAQKEVTVAKLSKTLALFRIWETVARARLHLANENVGLAQTDIEAAQSMLDKMAADGSGVLAEALQQTQTRLELAADNLPEDPNASVRDLNTAWEALDTALTTILEEGSKVEPTTEGE